MIRARHHVSPLRRLWLVMAMLAITLKVLVPPGYMAGGADTHLPFALVLCTADGAVTLHPGEDPAHPGKAPAQKSGHDAPCAFSGHGLGSPGPNLLDASPVSFVAYRMQASRPLIDLAPGRGLAAPPLPARGPPTLLT